jgi:hypothetical protein
LNQRGKTSVCQKIPAGRGRWIVLELRLGNQRWFVWPTLVYDPPYAEDPDFRQWSVHWLRFAISLRWDVG